MDDAQVIAEVRTGRTDAFGEIIEHYQAPIVRYLLRMTGDHEVAQDLAQDTFLQAFRAITKTGSELSFKAWLYKIATNNARQFHRRRRLLSFIPFADVERSGGPATAVSPDRVEERITVQEALLKVPYEQRVPMVLHFVEGLRYREIADVVGASQEAVRKRVARGSREFRKVYRRLSEDEER